MEKQIRIALAGNPNSGKTTLFNALTGANQFVGNWPGVTVEKRKGSSKNTHGVMIMDLPGIYSLSPYTLEEVVARDYLIGERPDAILNIVDGTNLERNLYLTTQLTELGIPVVVAVNMMDVVKKNGDSIHIRGAFPGSGLPGGGDLRPQRAGGDGGGPGGGGRGRHHHGPQLTPFPGWWSTPSPTSRRRRYTACLRNSSAGMPSSCLSGMSRVLSQLNLSQERSRPH